MQKIEDEAKDIEAGKGHNSKNRDPEYVKTRVRELAKELAPIEEQERILKEKKKKLRSTFKSDTGVVQADFNAARRLAEIEDELEQQEKMDNLSLAFNALSGRKQLSFFDEEVKKGKASK